MVERVRTFNCLKSLVNVKKFLDLNRKSGRYFFSWNGGKIGYHMVPFIIDLIVRFSSIDEAQPAIAQSDFEWLIDKYNNYPEEGSTDALIHDSDRVIPETMIRKSFEQFPSQEMERTLLTRLLYIYVDIPESNRDMHKEFLKYRTDVINRYFRVNIDDLLYCSFLLAALARKSDYLAQKLSISIPSMRHSYDSDAMPIVRNLLTISHQKYRSDSDAIASMNKLHAKYVAPILRQYPIIRIDTFDIVPDTYAIMSNVTRLIHEHFYRYHIAQGSLAKYLTKFGPIFKQYIGLILKMCMPNIKLIDIDTLERIKGKRADWLLIDGDKAIIFECKALKFTKKLKETGSLEEFEEIIGSKLCPGVKQLNQTEQQLRNDSSIVPEFKNVKTVHKCIVIEEALDCINKLINGLSLSAAATKIRESKIQIFSALDLEIVVESNQVRNFEAVFHVKFFQSSINLSLEEHVRNIRGFCFSKNSPLDKKFDEFFDLNRY